MLGDEVKITEERKNNNNKKTWSCHLLLHLPATVNKTCVSLLWCDLLEAIEFTSFLHFCLAQLCRPGRLAQNGLRVHKICEEFGFPIRIWYLGQALAN